MGCIKPFICWRYTFVSFRDVSIAWNGHGRNGIIQNWLLAICRYADYIFLIRVWRYQRGNQNPYFEDRQHNSQKKKYIAPELKFEMETFFNDDYTAYLITQNQLKTTTTVIAAHVLE